MNVASYSLRPTITGFLMTTLFAFYRVSFGEYRKPKPKLIPEYSRGKSYVYFIRSNLGIKIGYATNLYDRMSSIQSANPGKIELLGIIPGGAQTEQEIHDLFYKFRLRGEWFLECPELYKFINTVCE